MKLPIGSELKKSIANALDIRFEHGVRMTSGDGVIVEALRLAAAASVPPTRDINPYLHSARLIRDAMPQALSIDNFIDAHFHDKRLELCGKLAIARTILQAEAASTLFVDQARNQTKLDFGQLENTWFGYFTQLLTENCRVADLPARLASVVLIIFNYDRCIEHYLYYALQNYYAITPSDAALLLQKLEIYHPYGTVGSLPWLSPRNSIEFGSEPHPKKLLELAGQIKTFTEGTDATSSQIDAIRTQMTTAHRMVFLGFAFHRLNLGLLLPEGSVRPAPSDRRTFATGLGLSSSDAEAIAAELVDKGAMAAANVRVRNDLTCGQLFREYWRSMSFA